MVPRRKEPTDAVEILRRRYAERRPGLAALVEEEKANARIAQAVYDLRTRLGLSQRTLAKLVGTSASVICQLEDAEYQGHPTSMLERIAAATGQDLEMTVRFVPRKGPKRGRTNRKRLESA